MAANGHNADLSGGIVLGTATIAALIIANSSLGPDYTALIQATGEIRGGSFGLAKSLGRICVSMTTSLPRLDR